jgi:hypothetical protein
MIKIIRISTAGYYKQGYALRNNFTNPDKKDGIQLKKDMNYVL